MIITEDRKEVLSYAHHSRGLSVNLADNCFDSAVSNAFYSCQNPSSIVAFALQQRQATTVVREDSAESLIFGNGLPNNKNVRKNSDIIFRKWGTAQTPISEVIDRTKMKALNESARKWFRR